MNSSLAQLTQDDTIAGRYAIKYECGRTVLSVLYRAHDQVSDLDVCLKFPHRVVGGRPPDVKLLKDEFQATAKLNHDHIVKSYTFEYDNGQPFFVMEFLEGKTFEEVIPRGEGLPFEKIVLYAKQVKDALVAAHASRVVHRDLKPSNIMLEDSGNVKVLDFGIARLVKETFTRITNKSHPDGTLVYMAPEQLRGKERLVGPASDWYSFGVVLYEMITGHPPFRVGDITYQHLNEEPPPIVESRQDCPPGLVALVQGMLQKDPEVRSAGIPAFIETIDALADGQSPDAVMLEDTLSTAPRTRTSGRRRPVVTVLSVAIIAALAATNSWSVFELTDTRDSRDRLQAEKQQILETADAYGLDLRDLEAHREKLDEEIAKKKLMIEDQKKTLDERQAEIAQKSKRIRSLDGNLSNTREALDQTKGELSTRSQELTSLRSEHRALTAVRKQLDDHVSELEGQVRQMVSQNSTLRSNIDDWKRRTSALEGENSRLARALDSANEDRRIAVSTIQDIERKYNVLVNKYNRLNNDFQYNYNLTGRLQAENNRLKYIIQSRCR